MEKLNRSIFLEKNVPYSWWVSIGFNLSLCLSHFLSFSLTPSPRKAHVPITGTALLVVEMDESGPGAPRSQLGVGSSEWLGEASPMLWTRWAQSTGTCWRGTKADWPLEWPRSLVSINWVHEERRQVLWDRADKGTKARARMLPEGQAPPMRVTRMRGSSKPLDPCWGALLSSWGLNSHRILSPFVLFYFFVKYAQYVKPIYTTQRIMLKWKPKDTKPSFRRGA